jgi:hypothetical protein
MRIEMGFSGFPVWGLNGIALKMCNISPQEVFLQVLIKWVWGTTAA